MNVKAIAKILCTVLSLMIVFGAFGVNAYASQTENAPSSTVQQAKNGWVKKGERRMYFVNGKPVKSKLKKIKKYTYYFNKKGYAVEGKSVTVKNKTFYLSDKGHLRAYKKKNKFYHSDRTKMTTAEAEDWKARMNAEEIVAKITTKKMTKSQKLRACFNWVMKKPYITYRKFRPTDYWPATYANDHFTKRGGDCHADAGAFAYLAAAVGYKNVYVCNDSNGIRAQGHAWTEIDGRVYDPLFAQAKSFSKNYNVSYGTYSLRPILHINMDYNKQRPAK